MSSIKKLWYQYGFTTLMVLFFSFGTVATVGAMQVNPPEDIDQVVLGNVTAQQLNEAEPQNGDALLFALADEDGGDDDDDDDFFGFFDGPRDGRGDRDGRDGRRGDRGPRR